MFENRLDLYGNAHSRCECECLYKCTQFGAGVCACRRTRARARAPLATHGSTRRCRWLWSPRWTFIFHNLPLQIRRTRTGCSHGGVMQDVSSDDQVYTYTRVSLTIMRAFYEAVMVNCRPCLLLLLHPSHVIARRCYPYTGEDRSMRCLSR